MNALKQVFIRNREWLQWEAQQGAQISQLIKYPAEDFIRVLLELAFYSGWEASQTASEEG